MAVAFRQMSSTVGTGSSFTATEPTGTTQGDVLVALYTVDAASATIGIPSGWTSIYSGTSVSTQFRWNLCYIVRGASAPSLSFTLTGSQYRELDILAFSGCDNNTPINTNNQITSGTGTGVNPDPPSITTTVANTMVVAVGINWNGSSTGGSGWVAPSGYTMQSNNTPGNDNAMATKTLATATTENPAAFSGVGTTANQDYWAATLALAPPVLNATIAWFTA